MGESCEFRSRDDRTSGMMRLENRLPNGERIVKDKPNPGWWPCYDYPQLLTMIQNALKKAKPEAELVLWSYNWGKRPVESRLELIRNLPEGITLEVTFEMFERLEREGVPDKIADYALYFEGPGQYFVSEAEEAKKQGIRLYSMTNTAGATWEIGEAEIENTKATIPLVELDSRLGWEPTMEYRADAEHLNWKKKSNQR